jgi:hypothetical protein
MKVRVSQIREAVMKALQEAAAEGKMQKIYRRSFKRMINLARKGGNKYKASPFTKRAAGPGKSGLGPF